MFRYCVLVVLFFCTPASATDIHNRTAPADATSTINVTIAAGLGDVVLACGTWNISGSLLLSSGSPQVRGEHAGCTTIHLTGNNFAAFTCAGNPNQISVRDLTITGGAPNFNGNSNGISDLGQSAVHLSDCPLATIDNVTARNMSGTAFDCEQASSSFGTVSALRFSRLTVSNSYRGYWARNFCEYSIWSDLIGRNNVFGFTSAAGNVAVDRFMFVANYDNLQVVGSSIANSRHVTFSNGMTNHGYGYNIDVLSCSLGEDFVNVRALGDGGGSLTTGGVIRIANSKGINFIGGQMGSNVIILV